MARKYAIVAPMALAVVMLFLPMSAGADPESSDTATVVITATGFIVSPPSDLELSYLGEEAIAIRWTKGEGAANTLIRAAYGYTPSDREDGYFVYYGADTSAVDTSVDFQAWDNTPVYYRAWSETEGGLWEETGIWDWIEANIEIPTLLQALLVVGAAALAAWRKHIIISVAAAVMLLFVGIQLLEEGGFAFGFPTIVFGLYVLYSGASLYWQRRKEVVY